MSTPRTSLMRKRTARLAAVQALYSDRVIEQNTAPALLAAQLLQSWADSRDNDTHDLPHATQPEPALLTKLIEAAQAHRIAIDTAMEALIQPGWKKSRMSLPLLALLQVFAAECIAAPTRAAATLIEEYTEVGAQLLTDEELAYAHKAFNLLLETFRASA